jgi:NADH-ubiquinone oxidoreductase chain 5
MYLLIVYLYLILSILLMLFGKMIGYRGASILSCTIMGFATLLSYMFFFEVALSQSICSVSLWPWISFDLVQLEWCFFFDSLSVSMLIIISTVSLCAVAYSVEYMSNDPHIIRFFSYISLFVFFMVFLVTSSNLFQLFVGWEGVGICSYLLINFWFTRISANKSALLAVFVNKIGDIFVLISFGIIFSVYRTCDFSVLSGLILYCSSVREYVVLFGYLLLVGSIAKSAQVGLHIWLPEAMEGPTPVSSLIHAATMVTAGIFLLVRFSFVLEYNFTLLVLCMFIGSFTAFFGSSVGIFLYDIKKIIAYSTCSQLGYMLMSCGFSNYSYTMFHLISHAFFKALLFLTAGYIIHFCGNEQDIRKIGGLLKIFPSGYIFFLIGSISLIGFPFMSGFITKETILEAAYSSKIVSFYDLSILCQFISCFSLFFSVLYSVRLIIHLFFGQYSGFKYNLFCFHYSGYFILFPLFFLSLFSIFFGYVGKEAFIGEGSSFWQNSFFYDSISEVRDLFISSFFFISISDVCLSFLEFNLFFSEEVIDDCALNISLRSQLYDFFIMQENDLIIKFRNFFFLCTLEEFSIVVKEVEEFMQFVCMNAVSLIGGIVSVSEVNCIDPCFSLSVYVIDFNLCDGCFYISSLEFYYMREVVFCIDQFFNFEKIKVFSDFSFLFDLYLNLVLCKVCKSDWFMAHLDVYVAILDQLIEVVFDINYVTAIILAEWLQKNAILINRNLLFTFGDNIVCLSPVTYFFEYNINMNGFIFFSSLYFLSLCLIYGFFFSRIMNIYKLKGYLFFNIVYFLFSKKYFFFNKVFFFICTFCLFFFKSFAFLFFERGFLERCTSYGIVSFVRKCFVKYINLKTGIIYHYAGFFLFILFLWFLVLC